MPGWFNVLEVFAVVVVFLVGLTWSLAEAYWRGYRLRLPVGRVADEES